MEGVSGIEPELTESKSVLLPLQHTPTETIIIRVFDKHVNVVVMEGNDPSSSPYEGGAHPSTPHHLIGIPARTRTATKSFGDSYAAITPRRY